MNVVLGDNPFFAINHRDGGFDRHVDISEIRAVLSAAMNGGISKLMLSAHEQGFEAIVDVIADLQEQTGKSITLAIVTPLPHKFNDVTAASGYFGLLKYLGLKIILYSSIYLLLSLLRTGKLADRIGEKVISELIKKDIDYAEKKSVVVTHVCLHNVFADLLIA